VKSAFQSRAKLQFTSASTPLVRASPALMLTVPKKKPGGSSSSLRLRNVIRFLIVLEYAVICPRHCA